LINNLFEILFTYNFTVSFNTEKKGDVLRLAYYYAPYREYIVGAEISTDGADSFRKVLNVASQCEYNPNTTAKFRWSTCGDFGAAVEYRLRNPNVAVLLSTNLKLRGTSDVRADKFGVGFTFGEY